MYGEYENCTDSLQFFGYDIYSIVVEPCGGQLDCSTYLGKVCDVLRDESMPAVRRRTALPVGRPTDRPALSYRGWVLACP
ncbi:hypothetical protein EVAR_41334_1 [Eumeta japonica]|uniref:Uncharacterized protein n=1 Tax=Eumeta variegata TaxID=151549 RepID=A0A4C1X2U2_EUMVA|nr:hypothetical protein EVAR_41334_1 [Eumeta japonica]